MTSIGGGDDEPDASKGLAASLATVVLAAAAGGVSPAVPLFGLFADTLLGTFGARESLRFGRFGFEAMASVVTSRSPETGADDLRCRPTTVDNNVKR